MKYSDFKDAVLNESRNLNTVFIFVSMEDEVDTKPIILDLMSMGKEVVVPVIVDNELLVCSIIRNFEHLKKGKYGILEPISLEIKNKSLIDIFFVPGMKFDKKGNRKGRGKGYFDRFLRDIKGKKRIVGLCKKKQIVRNLKTNEWDVAVDKVIAL